MSTTRLTFLYPHLFRSARVSEPFTHAACRRPQMLPSQYAPARKITTSTSRKNRLVRRHGKAVEPFIPAGESPEDSRVFTPEGQGKDDVKSKELAKKVEEEEAVGEEGKQEHRSNAARTSAAPPSEESQDAAKPIKDDAPPAEAKDAQGEKVLTSSQQSTTSAAGSATPLATVLHMPAPASHDDENAAKPPHLQTPPYVHHFDTYTLVKQVGAGGFTLEQSITAMKAVRGLLAVNLDVAKAGLVSKSDVENETYLFRAACSELRTEVQNSRRKNEESMRRERTLLQHEVDILNQKLTQDLLTLKDDLKGMFDDRKMAVRSEQRSMESKIQELNYKITVLLNSDSKSEVEGLRWVLTRRSVMGILFMAFMVLTSLRYASWKTHEEELRKKREAAYFAMVKGEGGAGGGGGRGGMGQRGEGGEDIAAPGAAEILAAN